MNLETENFNGEKVFMIPEGFCLKTKFEKDFLGFQSNSTHGWRVYFVDPYLDNNIVLKSSNYEGMGISMPEYNENFHGFASIWEVNMAYYDYSLQEGKSCTDYSKRNSSYGKCYTGTKSYREYVFSNKSRAHVNSL